MTNQSDIYSTVAPWPSQDDGPEGRLRRGLAIAARVKITKNRLGYKVPSQSGNGSYTVSLEGEPFCTCPDFELTRKPCKHVFAAQIVAERDGEPGGVSPAAPAAEQDDEPEGEPSAAPATKPAALLPTRGLVHLQPRSGQRAAALRHPAEGAVRHRAPVAVVRRTPPPTDRGYDLRHRPQGLQHHVRAAGHVGYCGRPRQGAAQVAAVAR